MSANFEKDTDFKILIKYLNKNWFTKNFDMYNYSSLLEYKQNNNKDKNSYLEKFYNTNNISESLHRKINFYLKKTSTISEMFSLAIKKILIDDYIRNDKTTRYDFRTRAILKIIEDFSLNEKSNWINFKYSKIMK